MAIYKRPNSKYYWTKFRYRGMDIQRSTGCTSAIKAREFEAALRTQINLGRIGIEAKAPADRRAAKVLTVRAIIEEYIEWAAVNCAPSTVRRYRTAAQALIAHFGDRPAAEISKTDVERFIVWRRSNKKKAPVKKLRANPKAKTRTPIGNATINRETTLLSGSFKRQIDAGLLSLNPLSTIRPLKEECRHSEAVVSEEEFKAYIMAAGQPLRDAAQIIMKTGMRPSEVFALAKEHIDLENRQIRIARGKTASARRRIPIRDSLAPLLMARMRSAPGRLLFPGGKKGDRPFPLVKLNAAHNGAVKRSGVRPFRLYDLRHTFATRFVQSGGDLVALAGILGHSKLAMVTRYAHPTEQHQAEAMARLDRFMAGEPANVVPITAGRRS